MAEVRISGGCQCGAVRYALHEAPTHPHICHCRMCQKALGSYFAPLSGVATDRFEVTRGEIARFMSSDQAERGFCRDCGTPLTFRYVASQRTMVALGSLDHPADVKPARQFGTESRMSWFGELAALPGETTEAGDPKLAADIRATTHQHPDHDTTDWP